MTPLHGHDAAVAAFRAGLDSGRLHHAWLLAGPRGVGKGLFARLAALRVLAQGQERGQGLVAGAGLDVPDHHPAAALFQAGSHPDFRLVKREVWDKDSKKERIIPEHERSGTEDLARGIKVVQIRRLNASLGVTTSVSARRVVVIDSADDLEPGGANALLKSLEEPPASTIFLLVSHAPERLVPTIRSRCRLLRFGPLGEADTAAALRAALPDAPPAEIAALAAIADGVPGRALAWRGLDVAGLDTALRRLAADGDPINEVRSELAYSLSLKAAQPRYEAFLARAPSFIAAAAHERRGPALANALGLWERATDLAMVALRQSLDPQAAAFEMAGLVAGLADRVRKDKVSN